MPAEQIEECQMPNHVTTELKAPAQVLSAMLNEEGRIDFNKLIPFEGEFPWGGISGSAETAAEKVLGTPIDGHPLIGQLQQANRERVDIKGLSDEDFEQFVQMLKNHRKTGFMHTLDFARANWGTKWNAYDQSVDLDSGVARMDTAWSFPEPLLLKLSAQFPEAQLDVRYADEDIGSNCGTLVIKGGAVVSRDESGRWDSMTKAEQDKWCAFAYEVKGWEPEEDDD